MFFSRLKMFFDYKLLYKEGFYILVYFFVKLIYVNI